MFILRELGYLQIKTSRCGEQVRKTTFVKQKTPAGSWRSDMRYGLLPTEHYTRVQTICQEERQEISCVCLLDAACSRYGLSDARQEFHIETAEGRVRVALR